MLDYSLEQELWDSGYEFVCGVDEAGRGPLCGPVVAAAVILPRGLIIDGLNDSKKLSAKKRDAIYDLIIENAVAYAIEQGSVEEINSTNILEATMNAMRRAVSNLSQKADFALIDGNCQRNIPIPAQTIVKGDAISASVAAASILAKVTRDRQCIDLDAQYPEYGIAKHKGYPTKDHMDAVRRLGPTPIYRMSFLKFLDKE